MTSIHEQLVRDHVGQLIRGARRADRVKLARRVGRATAENPARASNRQPRRGTRQLRRCDDPATRQA